MHSHNVKRAVDRASLLRLVSVVLCIHDTPGVYCRRKMRKGAGEDFYFVVEVLRLWKTYEGMDVIEPYLAVRHTRRNKLEA